MWKDVLKRDYEWQDQIDKYQQMLNNVGSAPEKQASKEFLQEALRLMRQEKNKGSNYSDMKVKAILSMAKENAAKGARGRQDARIDSAHSFFGLEKAPFNLKDRQQQYQVANAQAKKRILENLPAKMKGSFDNAFDKVISESPNLGQYEVGLPTTLYNALVDAIRAGVSQSAIEKRFAMEYGVTQVKVDMDNKKVIFYK